MKVIVSHDVDHLYRNDHYRDLFYVKLWIRTIIHMLKGWCTVKEGLIRIFSVFKQKQNFIPEIVEFDLENDVPSTFFFGMEKGLGMSYGSEKCVKAIKYIESKGLDVGVHGVSYNNFEEMKREHNLFRDIVQHSDFGIRMHYVRYDDHTFERLSKCGYAFDTTEFDKNIGIKNKKPYKINAMWEFPLQIMDGYLPYNYDEKIKRTIEIIDEALKINLPYITILFHDCYFNQGYCNEKEWYKWTINWLKKNGYEFISYSDAIKEMEEKCCE